MSDAKFIGADEQLCNALRHMADNRPITKAEKAIVREAAERIAQARREALEEAAQVAEKHLNGWKSVGKGVPVFDYIPIDIRALIEKEGKAC